MSDQIVTPEFSRPFAVERLGPTAAVETLEANAAERAALAERFGLVAVDRLAASLRLHRESGDIIRVAGRLEADVVQTCVVTLEPFPSHVEDSFTADFTEHAQAAMPTELELDPEYEPPETVEGGVIDTGELVAQFLSLALDPHPRAPGATLESVWQGDLGEETSPFAVLKALKSGA